MNISYHRIRDSSDITCWIPEDMFGEKMDLQYCDEGRSNAELSESLSKLRDGCTLYIRCFEDISTDLRLVAFVLNEIERKNASLISYNNSGSLSVLSDLHKKERGLFLATLLKFVEGIKGKTSYSYSNLYDLSRSRGGGQYTMDIDALEYIQSCITQRTKNISELAQELGVSRQTLYRYISPQGEYRAAAKKLLMSME